MSDTAKPPPTARTEVTVLLTDVNDEEPTFQSRHYIAEINENAQVNVPVNFLGESVAEVYDHDQVHESIYMEKWFDLGGLLRSYLPTLVLFRGSVFLVVCRAFCRASGLPTELTTECWILEMIFLINCLFAVVVIAAAVGSGGSSKWRISGRFSRFAR